MAVIAPFRGLRYNLEKVGDLSRVVAPPYDVISPEDQQRYYESHPCNIIRVILGAELPGDTAVANRYTRAAEFLARWQGEGILRREASPALYLYEQTFPLYGEKKSRRGLLCLVRLEEIGQGTIYPHEQTFPKHKRDRLALMRACSANLSPVFSVFPGHSLALTSLIEEAERRAPAVSFTDGEGIGHRLFVVTEGSVIAEVAAELKDLPLVIADGHHRYETALSFREEMRARDGGDPSLKTLRPYNYVMMTVVSGEDPGLSILPLHRLVRTLPRDSRALLEGRILSFFREEIHPLPVGREAESVRALLRERGKPRRAVPVLGLYEGGERLRILTLEKEAALDEAVGYHRSSVYRRLDVLALHALLLDPLREREARPTEDEGNVVYTSRGEEGLRLVREGRACLAFLLNPTLMTEVQAVAMAGERMPPKTTFFYPKLLSGLVLHPIHRDESVPPVGG